MQPEISQATKQNINNHASAVSSLAPAHPPTFRPRRVMLCLCVLAICAAVGLVTISLLVSPDAAAKFGATPDRLVWLAFMGRTFALHATLATMAAAVVGVLIARKGRWLFVAPVVLMVCLSWPEARLVLPRAGAASTARIPAHAQATADGTPINANVANNGSARAPSTTLRVLSMNLLFLSNDKERVLAQIRAADADVVVLQEYHQDWDLDLYPALREAYPFECRPLREGIFGQAVYSRVPFVGEPTLLRLHRDDYCPQVGVVVNVGGREIEVWDIHLISPSNAEYIKRQCEQMRVLRAHLEKRTRPVVLLGDFNSTAMSWTASTLRSLDLREAHATVGSGRGATWPMLPLVRYVPGVRIDQAWASREIEWLSSRVMRETGSDHLPICVELRVKREE